MLPCHVMLYSYNIHNMLLLSLHIYDMLFLSCVHVSRVLIVRLVFTTAFTYSLHFLREHQTSMGRGDLTSSRQGQDKRGRRRSAAILPNELSRENAGNMWQTYGNMWQHVTTCGNMCALKTTYGNM